MPGVLGVFSGSGLPGRWPRADPAQPGAVDPLRFEADRTRRRHDLLWPAAIAPRGQSASCRRGGRDGGGRNSAAGARRGGGGGGRVSGTAAGHQFAGGAPAGRAGGLGRGAGQCPRRHDVRRQRGDRPRLCRGRPCRRNGSPHRPGDRGADRAAGRTRPIRPGERPLHALCGQRRAGPAKDRARRGAGGRPRAGAGAVLRCRRQFRRAQPGLCRVRPGAVGGAQARPAGQIHGDPLGGVSQRFSGPRSA